jgi:hypothetical protein
MGQVLGGGEEFMNKADEGKGIWLVSFTYIHEI